MNLDTENAMPGQRGCKVNEVVSHAESDFNDKWPVGIEVLIKVDHFVMSVGDSVSRPPFAQSLLLAARHLSTVAEIAGGPSELAVSFQVRHFKFVRRSVFYEHDPLDNK